MIAFVALDRNQLVLDNLGLVGDVTNKLWNRANVRRLGTRDDVEQIGRLGLLSAADKHEPGGAAFSTYAYRCIYNEIVSAACRDSWKELKPLSDMEAEGEEPPCEKVENTALLRRLLARLKPGHELVLRHRFCLLGSSKWKISKLAKKLKVSERRICAIQRDALLTMREWTGNDPLFNGWLKGWIK